MTTVYFNRLGLRVMLKPHKFDPNRVPRFAQPTLLRDRPYYKSEENRGYLATGAGAVQTLPPVLAAAASAAPARA